MPLPTTRRNGPRMFKGREWLRTHQQTVDSVLGPRVRKVYSRGANFFNKDAWTARAFFAAMCEWARLNPGLLEPTRADVEEWVERANSTYVPSPSITIAQTPDELDHRTAMALVGGAYHEAWHTEQSRRTPLQMSEVWPRVRDLWRKAPIDPETNTRAWGKVVSFLLTWDNIIDDIRIERRGCEKYPGAREKMEALQDLILGMEGEGREEATGHRTLPKNAMSVVVGAFRDIGLGYDTPLQAIALMNYEKANKPAWDLVHTGEMRQFVDRAINLSAKPDLEGSWLAMEVVAFLLDPPDYLKEPPKPDSEGSEDGGEGEPQQGGASAPPDADSGKGGKGGGSPKFKRGQRARLKSGPNKGKLVEVVKAGLPDPKTGEQKLEYKLVPDTVAGFLLG